MNRIFLLRAVVVALVVSCCAFVAGGAKWFLLSRARRASLAEWTQRRAYRDIRGMVDAGKASDAHLGAAKKALGAGDDARAGHELAAALERSRAMERGGAAPGPRLVSGHVARVLDILDAHPSLGYHPEVRAQLARTTLSSTAHPFESWRLRENLFLLEEARKASIRTWAVADARAADRAETIDPALAEMTRAVARRDLATCEAIAGRARLRHFTGECASAIEIEKIDARLRGAKVRWGHVHTNGDMFMRPPVSDL